MGTRASYGERPCFLRKVLTHIMNRTLYQGEYFSICQDEYNSEFVQVKDDEVLIVPLTSEGEVIFITEPSSAFGTLTLIVPTGSIELNERQEGTVSRELQEEIGYAPGRLDFLGELRPFSKYLKVRSFVYLARALTPSVLKGDEDYPIQIQQIPLATFETLIASGALLDARVIAALFMTRNFLQRSL